MTRAPSSRSTAAITSSPRARPPTRTTRSSSTASRSRSSIAGATSSRSGTGEEGLYHRGTRHLSGLRAPPRGRATAPARLDHAPRQLAPDDRPRQPGHGARRAIASRRNAPPVAHEGAVGRRVPRTDRGPELRPGGRGATDLDALRGRLRRHLRGARNGTTGARERSSSQASRTAESCWRTTASTGCGARRRSASPRSRIGSSRAWPPTRSSSRPVARRRSSCGSTAMARRRHASVDFGSALARFTAELDGRFDRSARISSSSELFDDWVTRSLADIVMMTSETADGPYPVRRHPVVQHGLRPRRHRHRVPDAVGPAHARPRRAEAPRRAAGHRRRSRSATPSPARSCTSSATVRWRR